MEILDVAPEEVNETCLFCIRKPSHPGHRQKAAWFDARHREGLRLKIARDDEGQQAAFIEYVPIESAWRPVDGSEWMFIHCLMTPRKEHRGRGYASTLVRECEEDARDQGMQGVAVMTSPGTWMASASVFENLGYVETDQRGRFRLLVNPFEPDSKCPRLRNWQEGLQEYSGWHLLYANQCPWLDKSVTDLSAAAREVGIELHVRELLTPTDAQMAPSGYGVYALLKDGRLLADHYISRTRFMNILKKELPDA